MISILDKGPFPELYNVIHYMLYHYGIKNNYGYITLQSQISKVVKFGELVVTASTL